MVLLCSFALFLILWRMEKRIPAFCFFYFAITNGFGLKIAATKFDLTYLSFAVGTFAVVSYLRDKNTNLFSYSIENGILLIYCFLGLSFYFTIFFEIDTSKYAFVVFRSWGLISIFLLFRCVNSYELDDLIKWFLAINVIWIILYYLQFAGLDLFVEESFKTAYKRNCPRLNLFFAILSLFYCRGPLKWVLFLFFSFSTITSGFRTLLTSFFIACTFFYGLIQKNKAFVFIGLISILGINLLMNVYFSDIFNRNGNMSFLEEIKKGFEIDYKHFQGMRIDGTFAYRTNYLIERLDFLLNNPKYMLFGVGSIYEGSPNNHFHFYIQDSGIIETDDLFWAAPLLRYGFVGVGLYVLFFVFYYRYFRFQNLNEKMVKVGMIFFLTLLFSSLSTWSFARPENVLAMGLCYYRVKNSFENKLEWLIHA